MNLRDKTFDIIVVGGGPVGAAAALELDRAGFSVLLIEARAPGGAPATLRPLALSYGSRLILERLGLWERISPATPIERIHISQRGRFGRTVLTAAEAGFPALGYVTDYASLVSHFDAALDASTVQTLRAAHVDEMAHGADSARVTFSGASGAGECVAALVVVADGSALSADVEVTTTDYRQSAITALVRTSAPHSHTAYERFTPDGPIALLPFDESYALVWTVRREDAAAIMSESAQGFLAHLQERFGERVGRFVSVDARASYDLTLKVARATRWGRAVLIGNAAQALHPVAGQGFNLGLRDAWELATLVRRCGPHDEALPHAFETRRDLDRRGGVGFTDTLIKVFSNDFAPLAFARGAGLALLDNMPPAKDFVVRRMVFGSRA